jgi:hypothetical protein
MAGRAGRDRLSPCRGAGQSEDWPGGGGIREMPAVRNPSLVGREGGRTHSSRSGLRGARASIVPVGGADWLLAASRSAPTVRLYVGSVSQRVTALATAARDGAPSLTKTRDKCASTVFSLRKSRAAIWRLVRPLATISATSRSLALSCGRARPGAARSSRGLRHPKRRSSRAASSQRRTAPQAVNSKSAR